MSNSSLKSLLKLGGPWFYVCFGSREGRGMGDGFVVQTYSDLYKLLTEESADKTEADVYICSKERGGRMALRRVVALRPVGSPNMHAFELEDGQVVLWVDGKTSATVYIEIGGRVSLVD
ncbi:hypothetical protein [Paraburkholderia sp. JPY465]|uniref:hypothetical protein n=1 Tax=Paraburkholderia sp. JPY465 TaxID=3042285 RepID=UPI003D2572BA